MPVTAVVESQAIDAAQQLVDVYEISYTIPDPQRPGSNLPGVFTVEVPKTDQALDEAVAAINRLTQQVTGLYQIP